RGNSSTERRTRGVALFRRFPRSVALPFVAVALAFALLSGGCTVRVQVENAVGQGVNQIRAQAGLPPLTADPQLAAIARHRAQDMANLDYFSHSPPDGCPARCLMEQAGITPGWTGEIMAWDDASSASMVAMAVSMWSNSATHMAVITGRCFTRMGAGAAFTPEGKSYFVVDFEGDPPGCQQ
ncbi:MAG: CAP domain-containing protein, partial [Dehalococcoidia bacterium]